MPGERSRLASISACFRAGIMPPPGMQRDFRRGKMGLVGGWEWAVVSGFVLLVAHRIRLHTTALLGAAAPGLVWVVMFNWSGDRRLFFPCTMQYTAQLTCLLRERGE